MKTALSLGGPLRFRIRLDGSWAIALLLITAIVVTQFPDAYPFWERVALGVAASSLYLAAIMLREGLIGLLAASKGIDVKEVTVYFFGGVSHVAPEETSPALELLLGAAGLLSNMIMAGVFYALHAVLVNTSHVLFDGIILFLSFVYIMLILLHLAPVFPLDGGRIVRALLWKVTGKYNLVTRILAWAGQVAGFIAFASGIFFLVYSGEWVNGLVLALTGWVLFVTAAQSHRPAIMRKVLDGVLARDVIETGDLIVPPELKVSHLVRDHVMTARERHFAVASGGVLLGLVGLREIKSLPMKKWDSTTVDGIMQPAAKLMLAQVKQPAASLLEGMEVWRVEAVPVMEEGKVVGVVSRDYLAHLLKTRQELSKIPLWK